MPACVQCLKNVPSLAGYSFNARPPIFTIFGTHVISRDQKIGWYNFPKYLAFTYFIMLLYEMTEMTRFPRHCYGVTGALCNYGFWC